MWNTSSVNTQISSLVIPQLRELMELFIDAGAKSWQVQLTVAMGKAADHPELLRQPYELLELMPLLAELYQEGADRGFLLLPGNNIGYFGPYESLWRGSGDDRIHWTSCNAGQNTLGHRGRWHDQGMPFAAYFSLPGGNIRDKNLKQIWWTTDELSLNRDRTSTELWGFCGSCYYADVCKAGCTWTTHVLFGRAGNNPYCHHRAMELSKQGLRERIAQVEKAPGTPFDHGQFELIVETVDEHAVGTLPMASGTLVQIKPAKSRQTRNTTTPPKELILMPADYVAHVPTRKCAPFCKGNVPALTKRHEKEHEGS